MRGAPTRGDAGPHLHERARAERQQAGQADTVDHRVLGSQLHARPVDRLSLNSTLWRQPVPAVCLCLVRASRRRGDQNDARARFSDGEDAQEAQPSFSVGAHGTRAYPKRARRRRDPAAAVTASQPAARSRGAGRTATGEAARLAPTSLILRRATRWRRSRARRPDAHRATFAVEVARAAAADRSTASTEEGDVRALGVNALPNSNRWPEPQA